MLTNRQQFQAEFLCKAARAGLTAEQAAAAANALADRLEKKAKGPLDTLFGFGDKAVDVGVDATKKVFDKTMAIGIPLLAAGPFVGGMTAGLGYRSMTDIEDDDVDAAKIRELTATYQQLAQQARRKDLLRTIGR